MSAEQNMPCLTADQMREVDRIMIEEMHITLFQMMENAGRSLADLAIQRFQPGSVQVLAGPGGNGGGGLVAARHLINRGFTVHVTLTAKSLGEVPAHQLDILKKMGASISEEPIPVDLIIDAIFGYSLQGDPTGRAVTFIEWANQSGSPILSLDCPSGLDITTGRAAKPCIRASATMTLALLKTGLLSSSNVGQLFLADISVPVSVYQKLGISVSPRLFAAGSVVMVEPSGR